VVVDEEGLTNGEVGDRPQPRPKRRLPSGLRRVRTYNQMVVDTWSAPETDSIFHALADATRRDIVRTVLVRAHSVSALARQYPMSFAAVQKHVAVLEEAGLVSKQRRGRESLVRGDIHRVRDARSALDALELLWRDRVAQMDQILAEDP
jgi:DNA-binding transcriptional ArsR family regulator